MGIAILLLFHILCVAGGRELIYDRSKVLTVKANGLTFDVADLVFELTANDKTLTSGSDFSVSRHDQDLSFHLQST